MVCGAEIRIQCIGDPLNGEVRDANIDEKASEALKSCFKFLDVLHTTLDLVPEASKFGHFGIELVASPRKIVGYVGKVSCEVDVGLTEAENIAFGLVDAVICVHVQTMG